MTIDESYRELGLSPNCSEAEAKEAWRRLAARWHPDRNASPHALRKIQRINGALAEIRRVRGFAPTAPAPVDSRPAPPEPAAAPQVVEHQVSITLEEACTGCTRELHGEVVEDCGACHGRGAQGQLARCADCEGSGRARPPLWVSWLGSSGACAKCEGTGKVRARCVACEGGGKARPRKYRCSVAVPAGTRAGEMLEVHARVAGRLRHHDLALRVRVQVQPHPLFGLEADGTVTCELPVDGFSWMAERWIEVPTPSGPQQMRLRRGFLAYRIKGEGLPSGPAGERADCRVTVVPLFPEELNKEQLALLDKLVAANTGAPRTAPGARMATWKEAVARWQAQQPPRER